MKNNFVFSRNRIVCIVFCAFLFVAARMEAQVSREAEMAFQQAKLRLLKDRKDPANFTLPLLNGGNRALSSFKGKVVILNFWATWCPPCRAEMPSMEILYQRLKNQGLELLAVDIGEDQTVVRDYIGKGSYSFPVLLDRDTKVSNQYGISAIPTSFILDREGKIISMIVGSIRWDDPKVIAAFEELLKSR